MKLLLLCFLLVSAAVPGQPADNPSLNGNWQIHNNIAGNETDQSCTFTQKGSELTGICSSEHGEVKISGKVNEKQVTWIYKSEYNGGPITLSYKGAFDSAAKLKGTVNVEEYSVEGDFTATTAK